MEVQQKLDDEMSYSVFLSLNHVEGTACLILLDHFLLGHRLQ